MHVSRLMMSGILVYAAVIKMSGLHQDHYLVPRWLFGVLGPMEVGIAAILWTRWVVPASAACAVIATAGVLLGWAYPRSVCGCLGRDVVSGHQAHMLTTALLGFCSVYAIYYGSGVRLSGDTRAAVTEAPIPSGFGPRSREHG